MWGRLLFPIIRVLDFAPDMLTQGIILFGNTLLMILSKLFLLNPVRTMPIYLQRM